MRPLIDKIRHWLRWRITQMAHRRRAQGGSDFKGIGLSLSIVVLLFLIFAMLLGRAGMLGQLS